MSELPAKKERIQKIIDGEILAPWPDSPQEQALQSDADIVIFGGAAGGAKSYGLLLGASRGYGDKSWRGAIFRRTFSQLSAPGGLIDESRDIYPRQGGEYKSQQHRWEFPHPKNKNQTGAWLKFSHMQFESDRKSWDGAQLTFIGFDQLEQFERSQFFYMLGRLRSPNSKYDPQLFATCNPTGEDHWLYKFIQWWLDEDGFPIEERAGKKRYFFREDDEVVWADADATDATGLSPTSVTFVPATVEDNPAIIENDPKYVQRLNSLGRVDRLQKRFGRWGVSRDEGLYKNHSIRIVPPEATPDDLPQIRYWDLADTDGRGAATASARVGMTREWRWCCQNTGDEKGEGDCLAEFTEPTEDCPECGHEEVHKEKRPVFWVFDVTEWHLSGDAKEKRMEQVANADGTAIHQGIEQEPGSSGKRLAIRYTNTIFSGHITHVDRPTGEKTSRAKSVIPAAERGRLILVQAAWNERFLEAIEDFPNAKLKDIADALHGACGLLEGGEIRHSASWGFTF